MSTKARQTASLVSSQTGIGVTISGDPVVLGVGNTELLRVTGSGDIGINTDNPSEKLEVNQGNISLTTKVNLTTPKYSIDWTGDGAGQVAVFSANTSTGEVRMGADNSSGTYFTTLYSNGAEALRILSSGGITFNGDTAAANALDDYEEGTFTPTFAPSTGSFSTATYSDRVGQYRKIGSMVYIQIRTNFSAFNVGSASGQPIMTGLPFTPDTNFPNCYLNVGQCNNWTNAPSGALVDPTNNRIVFLENSNNPGFNNDFSEIADLGATSENRTQISGWYVST